MKFLKLENTLLPLKSKNVKVQQSADGISSEMKDKEAVLENLEETRIFLENEVDRVETDLAEKRLQASKFSTNDQLYQFRVGLYRRC